MIEIEKFNKNPQSFRLNQSVIQLLEIVSNNTGESKTAVIEKAIIDYYRRYDKELETNIYEQVQEIYKMVKEIRENKID